MKRATRDEFEAIIEEIRAAGNPTILESLEFTKRALGWSTEKAARKMLEAFESDELILSSGSQGKAMDLLRAIINAEGATLG